VTFPRPDKFPDGDEVYEAGDAFYTPPGHIPVAHQPGSEIVMFSPAEQLDETEAVDDAEYGGDATRLAPGHEPIPECG
jgi:hypothetical protein